MLTSILSLSARAGTDQSPRTSRGSIREAHWSPFEYRQAQDSPEPRTASPHKLDQPAQAALFCPRTPHLHSVLHRDLDHFTSSPGDWSRCCYAPSQHAPSSLFAVSMRGGPWGSTYMHAALRPCRCRSVPLEGERVAPAPIYVGQGSRWPEDPDAAATAAGRGTPPGDGHRQDDDVQYLHGVTQGLSAAHLPNSYSSRDNSMSKSGSARR